MDRRGAQRPKFGGIVPLPDLHLRPAPPFQVGRRQTPARAGTGRRCHPTRPRAMQRNGPLLQRLRHVPSRRSLHAAAAPAAAHGTGPDRAQVLLRPSRAPPDGKEHVLRTLANALTDEGRYASVLLSLEVGAPFPDKLDIAEGAILSRWREVTDFALPADLRPPPWPDAGPGSRVSGALQAWAWQSAYENRASDASSSPC